MTASSHPPRVTPPPVSRRHRLAQHLRDMLPDLAAFCGALLCAGLAAVLTGMLAGCGGGVGSEGTGTGAVGSFSSGTITGFGSIVVNGVHYDESSAVVQDDDGLALARSSLALGMVVQITGGPQATAADGTPTAVASAVRTNRALVGPAAAINLSAGSLSVLGQTVLVSADTVFDTRLTGGLAQLGTGRLLEVYGYYDSARAAYSATRIGPADVGTGYRVSGPVAAVDAQAKTFTLGSQTYSLAAAGSGASSPASGDQVRLMLQPSTDSGGRWVVSTVKPDDAAPKDSAGAEINGVVSAVLEANRFVVNGVLVDASAAKLSGPVRVGSQVRVSGKLQSGVLLASSVQANSGSAKTFELSGTLSSLDTANRRFVVRGTAVGYARPDLQFSGGTAARLAGYTGKLKVEGLLSADRTVLDALRIKFED